MLGIFKGYIQNCPNNYFFYGKHIKRNFDLTPKGIIEYLGLRELIFTKTTNYGHFGKPELPWEKIIELK